MRPSPIVSMHGGRESDARSPHGRLAAAARAAAGAAVEALEGRYLLAAGDLDPTFGAGGIRYFDPSLLINGVPTGVAVQSDGKIVSVGTAPTRDGTDFGVARYLPDGRLDPSFGDRGVVTTHFGDGLAGAQDVVIQPDNKIVVAGSAKVGTDDRFVGNYRFAVARYNPDGSLDTSFGGGSGIATIDFWTGNDLAFAVALAPGNRIVLAGQSAAGNPEANMAFVRLLPDGTLDNTFSENGKHVIDIAGNRPEAATSVLVQSDGRITAGGWHRSPGGPKDFAVVRLTAAGNLDATFSGDGKQTADFQGHDDTINDIAFGPGGSVVAVGSAVLTKPVPGGEPVTDSDYALARFTPAGALDPAFGGGDGLATDHHLEPYDTANPAPGVSEELTSVLVRGDGRIVAGGRDAGYTSTAVLAGYTATGGRDPGFAQDGYLPVRTGAFNVINDIAFDADGRLAFALSQDTPPFPSHNDWVAGRADANGTLDAFFGDGGLVKGRLDGFVEDFRRLATQQDGKIIAVGPFLWQDHERSVARFNTDGTLDTTFGDRGTVALPHPPFTAFEPIDAAVLGDDRILVSGKRYSSGRSDLFAARLTAGGQLDTTFGGGDGLVVTDLAVEEGQGYLDARPDGSFVLAGTLNAGSPAPQVGLARFTASGQPDASFNGGVVRLPAGGDFLWTAGVEFDSTGGVLIAYNRRTSGTPLVGLVTRVTPAGQVDSTYGDAGGGAIAVPLGTYLTDFAMTADDRAVVLGNSEQDEDGWYVNRLTPGGRDDPEFGTMDGGGTLVRFGFPTRGYGLDLQPDGKVLTAGTAGQYPRQVAVARLTSGGRLDTTYGGDGKVVTDAPTTIDVLEAVALDIIADRQGRALVAVRSTEQAPYSHGPTLVRYQGGGLQGDVNLDGAVNGSDFAILAGNFGKPGMTHAQGDLNGDGRVDGSDFAILAGNFGKTAGA